MSSHAGNIQKIRELPSRLEALVSGLTPEQLTTAYMPNEWTVAQNVHHLADTHMNCFRHFKMILTRDDYQFQPLGPDDWAALPDADNAEIEDSLLILRGLHCRWATLLESLGADQWARFGLHATRGQVTLEALAQTYAKHGEDHLAQIQSVLDAMG